MAKRKFKVTCQESNCRKSSSEPTELMVEIEDGSNVEQEAANALCRKLEEHFKEKHPNKERNAQTIKVLQGNKWAVLQANGSIREIDKSDIPEGYSVLNNAIFNVCSDCDKRLEVFWDNKIEEHNCSNNNPNREREREREREQNSPQINQIKQYFQSHNIKSAKLEGDKLVFEYNNATTETKDINNAELKAIQSYCQQKGVSTLNLSDLQQSSNTGTDKPFNWTPYLIGGGILVVLIIGLVLYFVRKNNQARENI